MGETPLNPTNAYNIDRLLNDAKAGRGELAKQFSRVYNSVESEVIANHKLAQSRDPELADLSKEDTIKQINKAMDDKAKELKGLLTKAAKGESTQTDWKQYMGAATAGQQFMFGGIFEKISAFMSLSTFGPLMDVFAGIASWMKGDGFTTGYQASRANRSIGELAGKLEINENVFKEELNRPIPGQSAAPAPEKPASSLSAEQKEKAKEAGGQAAITGASGASNAPSAPHKVPPQPVVATTPPPGVSLTQWSK